MAWIETLQELSDEQLSRLTPAQFALVEELEAQEIPYGFWFYGGVWDVAESLEPHNQTYYWEIGVKASRCQMLDLAREVQVDVERMTGCHCTHDCCGHWFIQNVWPCLKYEAAKGSDGMATWVFVESWGQNV